MPGCAAPSTPPSGCRRPHRTMGRGGSNVLEGAVNLTTRPHWIYFGSRTEPPGDAVAVNLSIKNVPDQLAASLRVRATRNHRSIQGELMAILEEALESDRRLDARKLLSRVRKLKLATHDQATRIVRADRDGH